MPWFSMDACQPLLARVVATPASRREKEEAEEEAAPVPMPAEPLPLDSVHAEVGREEVERFRASRVLWCMSLTEEERARVWFEPYAEL